MLEDYEEQLGKPFEYEARLKELLAKQAELNAALDLDKGERQVAPEEGGDPQASDDAPGPGRASPTTRLQRTNRRGKPTGHSAGGYTNADVATGVVIWFSVRDVSEAFSVIVWCNRYTASNRETCPIAIEAT
jgi:hypothetical protein